MVSLHHQKIQTKTPSNHYLQVFRSVLCSDCNGLWSKTVNMSLERQKCLETGCLHFFPPLTGTRRAGLARNRIQRTYTITVTFPSLHKGTRKDLIVHTVEVYGLRNSKNRPP